MHLLPIQTALGITGGIFVLLDFGVYGFSILRGKTLPSKSTWLVLGVMGTITAIAYYYTGAKDSLWLALGNAAGPVMIFALSLKYGAKWSWSDFQGLIGGSICIGVWLISKSPALALYVAILADVFALWPTVVKTFNNPKSESLLAWLLGTIASALSVASLTYPTEVSIAAYPIYFLCGNLVIVWLIIRRYKMSSVTN